MHSQITFLVTFLLVLSNVLHAQSSSIHSRDDRIALFTYINNKTMEREAFSTIKNEKLGLDYKKQAEALREEFVNAESDKALFLALMKLSAIRSDRHLLVKDIKSGLDVDLTKSYAPIRFAPDFSVDDGVSVFVYDVADNYLYLFDRIPKPGDQVLEVNGMPLSEFAVAINMYYPSSTEYARKWDLTKHMARKQAVLEPDVYKDRLFLTLLDDEGNIYETAIDYTYDDDDFEWQTTYRHFDGFGLLVNATCFTLYKHREKKVVLIDWHVFNGKVIDADLQALNSILSKRTLWDHDLIFDATHAKGGKKGADLVAMLASEPFKTTFGNIRCCDVTSKMKLKYNDDSPLSDWFRNDVLGQCENGQEYSESVPFKLKHLPQDSDGFLHPDEAHFTGKKVFLFSSYDGSHVDQFAAMVIDNKLGYSVGMPTAGFSNTWEWREDLSVFSNSRNLASYMWSIGHTIRPNGEVLEGNPPEPDKIILFTKANFRTYYDDLLEEALRYLDK